MKPELQPRITSAFELTPNPLLVAEMAEAFRTPQGHDRFPVNKGSILRASAILALGSLALGGVLLDRSNQAEGAPLNPMSWTDKNGASRQWWYHNETLDPNDPNRRLVTIADKINEVNVDSFKPKEDFYPRFQNEAVHLLVGDQRIHSSKLKGYLVTAVGINNIYNINVEGVDPYQTTNLALRELFTDSNNILPQHGVDGDGVKNFQLAADGSNIELELINCAIPVECGIFRHDTNSTDGSQIGSWYKVVIQPTSTPTITPTPEATITPTPTLNVTATPTKTSLPLKIKALSLSAKAKIAKGLLTVSGKAKTDNRCLPASVESEINGQTSTANPRTMSAPSTVTQVIMTARDACQRTLQKILTVTPKN